MSSESPIILKEAIEQYLQFLENSAKSPRTLYTYGKDCEQILDFFGPDKQLNNILPAHVAKFYKSDVLLKIPKNGKGRALQTINKTKMVFKRLLIWAKEQGYIDGSPFPRSSK